MSAPAGPAPMTMADLPFDFATAEVAAALNATTRPRVALRRLVSGRHARWRTTRVVVFVDGVTPQLSDEETPRKNMTASMRGRSPFCFVRRELTSAGVNGIALKNGPGIALKNGSASYRPIST